VRRVDAPMRSLNLPRGALSYPGHFELRFNRLLKPLEGFRVSPLIRSLSNALFMTPGRADLLVNGGIGQAFSLSLRLMVLQIGSLDLVDHAVPEFRIELLQVEFHGGIRRKGLDLLKRKVPVRQSLGRSFWPRALNIEDPVSLFWTLRFASASLAYSTRMHSLPVSFSISVFPGSL